MWMPIPQEAAFLCLDFLAGPAVLLTRSQDVNGHLMDLGPLARVESAPLLSLPRQAVALVVRWWVAARVLVKALDDLRARTKLIVRGVMEAADEGKHGALALVLNDVSRVDLKVI